MALMCPKCGKEDNVVVNSRTVQNTIRRRRECEWCGTRFTTYESCQVTSRGKLWNEIRPKLIKNIKEAIIKSFQDA